MGGSSSAPKPSDAQRRNEKLQAELMEAQLKAAKEPLKLPDIKPPAPVRPPPPPGSQSSQDVAQSEEQARRAAMRRTNSSRGTLFAGETGGFQGGALGGAKTLLG